MPLTFRPHSAPPRLTPERGPVPALRSSFAVIASVALSAGLKSLFLIILILSCPIGNASAPRPNLLLIMADDMGFSDLSCYGGEIATPHLDRLAREGIHFTQFYNNAKCEPTRSSLLTGHYSQIAGASPTVVYRAPTFGELLRSAGYHTWMVGKWHAGQKPFDRGFDRHFGLTDGCSNYFNPGEPRPGEPLPSEKNYPRRWAEDQREFRPFSPADASFYATDAYTQHALNYLEQAGSGDRPFLLYVAYTAPHYPLHARPEDIARHRGRYRAGWDRLREERLQRQKRLGLISPETVLPPREAGVPAWDALPAAEQDSWDLRMSVYAAMIDRLDQNMGLLLAKLEEKGQAENTVVMFLSDNGGESDDTDYSRQPGTAPGPQESYRMVGPGWAQMSNTPFRRYKTWMHEGGIATPFLVRWPKAIAAGGRRNQVGHITDLVPTFLELAGTTYPDRWQGESLRPLPGQSLLPVFNNLPRPDAARFWQLGTAAAVRLGPWKLVRGRSATSPSAWELYHLEQDRNELQDLAARQPERVAALAALWSNWSRSLPPQN
jgi:arylsulfatase A-like enzyme